MTLLPLSVIITAVVVVEAVVEPEAAAVQEAEAADNCMVELELAAAGEGA